LAVCGSRIKTHNKIFKFSRRIKKMSKALRTSVQVPRATLEQS
jgi:anionic cell wall polymer biosynthesis LytR-Cps2A-Psr (LCP) family protein